jgi:hypothetical protein
MSALCAHAINPTIGKAGIGKIAAGSGAVAMRLPT